MMPPPRSRKGVNFLRRPNAELSAMSLEIDVSAISLAEGFRAALGTATLIALNQWLGWPLLNYVALGAFLSCLCDIGGLMTHRLISILSFAATAALLFVVFGVARAAGIYVVLPIVIITLFCNAMLRVWGQNAMQVGNMSSIVMILAIDRGATFHQAVLTGGAFAIGGLWAMLLTLVLWRLHPYQPARRAVGAVYRQLASLVDDMRLLAEAPDVTSSQWDEHARAHRRAVRDAIELARDMVHQVAHVRGPQSGTTLQSPIRLEAADEIFGALVGLSAVIENDAAARGAATKVLRLLGPLLRVMAAGIEHDASPQREPVERAIKAFGSITETEPPLLSVLGELSERLRLAISVAGPVVADMAPEDARATAHPWLERIQDRLLGELHWSSALLRHALRTVLLVSVAIAASIASGSYYSHWLSITLVVTLQPFFANTRQRAIERSLGTSAGVVGVSVLARALHTPLAMAGALVPVTVLAFALRRVSFTLFISGLTPFVVMLVELGHRDVGAGGIALQRMAYTIAGGIFAVAGNRFLWPVWEPTRLREALQKALLAHAEWMMADKSDDLSRRAAGRSSNVLETSLTRSLAEPRRARDRSLEIALVCDAALRRIGGHLTALALQTRGSPPDITWRGWAAEVLRAMARGGECPPRPQKDLPLALSPIVQQVELMAGASRRR